MPQNVVLRIDSPEHHSVVGAAGTDDVVTVPFEGTTVSTAHGDTALFHTWYSSLAAAFATGETTVAELRVGSHVVTFAAADKNDTGVPAEQLAQLYATMLHMGYAGGPPVESPDPDTPGPLVVHVLIAHMLAPAARSTRLSRSVPDLRAEVPLQWALPSYHELNRLEYVWRFVNLTRSQAPIVITQSSLTFHPTNADNDRAWLGHDDPLPVEIAIGDTYRVTLRVQDATDASLGHSVSRDLRIVA